ncbi:MAG TPA: hypothetical protein VHY09_13730 [Candidatus Methylacidiphilales bacterium]|jgi:hypothetical protein|nr:hypothetical protein [Candidatus Methylacidiphilales bacterium]
MGKTCFRSSGRLVALLLLLSALPAFSSESVLDQPAPAALCARFTTFHARLEALQHDFPLRVVLPAGLADFVAQIDLQESPASPFLGKTAGLAPSAGETYRSLLSDTCARLGLRWRNDAAQQDVVIDFAWRRDDSRSTARLLSAANFSQPTGMFGGDPWNQREWGPTTISENDNALRAFDALVSKPENFPTAWKLRFLEDGNQPRPAPSLWAGLLNDSAGAPRFVYLRYHPATSAAGRLATFACYVFTPDGRFLSGALLADQFGNVVKPAILVRKDGSMLYVSRLGQIVGSIALDSNGLILCPAQPHAGNILGRALWRSP